MQIQFLVGEQIGVIEIFENFETHRIRLNGKIDKSNESNRPISCAQETSFEPVVKSSKKIDNNNKNYKSNESNRPISCAQETCTGTFKTETELTKHNTKCHSDSFIMK